MGVPEGRRGELNGVCSRGCIINKMLALYSYCTVCAMGMRSVPQNL
jgi:hypothetical protein